MFLFQNPVMLLERSEFWFFIGFAFSHFFFFTYLSKVVMKKISELLILQD